MEELDPDTADYLESFNVDMGAPTDSPHYIINLNGKYEIPQVYESDGLTVGPSTSLDGVVGSLPSKSAHEGSDVEMLKKPIAPIPSPLVPQPNFRPSGRPRARGKGSMIPIDDLMEKKIMTFEGRDCVQHLDELQRLFPRFKRAHINRVFTRNMLNFERAYAQLSEENSREVAKCASVRLIHTNKDAKRSSDSKEKHDSGPLNPQSYMYLGVPLGRCPPHIANTLYRRVIVNPDGTVESADEHEKKYLDVNGLRTDPPALRPPRPQIQQSPSAGMFPRDIPANPLGPATTSFHPYSAEPNTTQTPGNRFFRSNRLCETEIKKRGYVDREMRNSKTPISRRSRAGQQKEADASVPAPVPTPPDKKGDAVQFMASVGVVSTPASKKRNSKKKEAATPKTPAKPAEEEEEPEENDSSNAVMTEKESILDFFNDARFEELVLMPGCSRKTAQIIISLRQFRNLNNLVARLSGTRHLSPNLIDSCKEVLQMRSMVVRLMQRCERITVRVGNQAASLLADNINLSIPAGDQNTPSKSPAKSSAPLNSDQLLTQQPAILNPLRELKPYQLVGLNWLRLLHREEVNGILADEMGLGKTIQAIAFLASLWEAGDRGPHLIMCPSSTQDNWLRELNDWCSHLKVLVYQGPADQRKTMRLKIYDTVDEPDFHILLTSYAIGTSTIEDRALMKRVNFHYGIFDEAHMLKNMSSQRYRQLSNIRVQRRLLLTGTPLQNNLLELVSLLSFLMPDIFVRSSDLLKRMFQIYSKSVNEREEDDSVLANNTDRSHFESERLDQAKNLLQPFFLRRLKSQVLSQLPTKCCEVIHVPMTESQKKHYWNLVEKLRLATKSHNEDNGDTQKVDNSIASIAVKRPRLTDSAVNGTKSDPEPNQTVATNNTHSPSNMIVQLRKAANHQTLLSGVAYTEASLQGIAETLHLDPSHCNSSPELIFDDLSVLSDHQVHKVCLYYDILSHYTLPIETIMTGSGKLAWLDENIPLMIKEGHRLLIFSQFIIVLDLLEEFLRARYQRYLRLDGSTPVSERQDLVDRFNSSSIEVFLLSTRAGGMGINLTGADTVIIHDLDFNPYNDRQAEDRVHRLGQTKQVRVIRLISEGTVEEGILRIANEKLRLEQDITGPSQQEPDQEDGAPESIPVDDLTESTDVVRKILGTNSPPTPQPVNNNGTSGENPPSDPVSRSVRISDRELWTLLNDTLKPTVG